MDLVRRSSSESGHWPLKGVTILMTIKATAKLNGHTITNNGSKLSANDASDILGAIAVIQGGKPYGSDGSGRLHTDTFFSAVQLKALDKLAAQLNVIAQPNEK